MKMSLSSPSSSKTDGGLVRNRLKHIRLKQGLSQGVLAAKVGVTRQALYAMEMNQYLPGTAVALRLAQVLGCAVEDMFGLEEEEEIIEASYIGESEIGSSRARVKMGVVGKHVLARPVAELGSTLNYTVAADGLMLGKVARVKGRAVGQDRVYVKMLRSRQDLESQVVIGGCDPAIFLVENHMRRVQGEASVVAWTMGSLSALRALNRGEIHVAGIHVVDHASGDFNLPFLRKYLKGLSVTVVRFAAWQEGLVIKQGNSKRIKGVDSLARSDVRMINREKGSGARLLLDHMLSSQKIPAEIVKGYGVVSSSQISLGKAISEGQADVGIGTQAVAQLYDLHFIPLQDERYDLVIPTKFLTTHPGMRSFLDTIVAKRFRQEIEALGGYDTQEIGKIIQ